MLLELSHVVHTRAEAFEALRRVAARRRRAIRLDPPRKRPDARRTRRNIAVCDALIDLLVAAFGMDGKELRSPTRCRRPVARVRQIGMYVAHTCFGMAMTDVAAGFARDRSTVTHACQIVEDMRDDEDFDAIVAAFERIVRSAFSTWKLAGKTAGRMAV